MFVLQKYFTWKYFERQQYSGYVFMRLGQAKWYLTAHEDIATGILEQFPKLWQTNERVRSVDLSLFIHSRLPIFSQPMRITTRYSNFVKDLMFRIEPTEPRIL